MSLRYLSHAPFELGEVLDGLASDGTTTINNEVLGGAFAFNAIKTTSPTSGVRTFYSQDPIVAIACRNTSGATLYGKRFGTLAVGTAGVDGLYKVNGYGDTLAEGSQVLIDPFLPSTGVPANGIFWGVVDGVCLALTPETGAGFNGADIAAGNELVGATAASSTGSATGGRVAIVSFTNATAGNSSNGYDGYRMALNRLGTALSARTTGETSSELLMRVKVSKLL